MFTSGFSFPFSFPLSLRAEVSLPRLLSPRIFCRFSPSISTVPPNVWSAARFMATFALPAPVSILVCRLPAPCLSRLLAPDICTPPRAAICDGICGNALESRLMYPSDTATRLSCISHDGRCCQSAIQPLAFMSNSCPADDTNRLGMRTSLSEPLKVVAMETGLLKFLSVGTKHLNSEGVMCVSEIFP